MPVDFKPKATSTIQFTPKSVQPTSVMPQPKQDGFLETVAKSVVSPFARLGVNAVKAGQMIAGQKVDPAKPMNVPWLGQVKPVGQEGSFSRRVLDAVGVGTEVAANVIPTTAPVRSVVPLAKATIRGAIGQGLKTGIRSGAVTGALYGAGKELQNPEATVGSVLGNTAIGGVTGGVTGGVIGGALPLPVAAVKGVTNAVKPTKIMQRVARVHALDQQKFQQTAKESVGDYLVKRGIYGNDEQIMTQLADRFTKSKNLADTEIAKLGGQWKAAPIKTALTDLVGRETRISTPGAPSADLSRVTELLRKHDSVGLTMTEINEVKRLFERNVKLDFLKLTNPEGVARANIIDDAIRKWQFSQAEKMGLNNLPEINKETQLAKMLGDALFKKNVRSEGNNAFGLTDAILLSGGDPASISMLLTKKTLGSKRVMSKVAKTIAGKPIVGEPSAITRAPIVDKNRLLPPANPTTNYNINQGRPIPVAPAGRSILLPRTGVQIGGDAAIPGGTTQLFPQSPPKSVLPKKAYTPSKPTYNFPSSSVIPKSKKTSFIQEMSNKARDEGQKGMIRNPLASQNPLIQEARKYKSAEAFVKAQGQKLYHGSPKADVIRKEGFKLLPPNERRMASAYGDGIYFTTKKRGAYDNTGTGAHTIEAFVPDNLKLFDAYDKDAGMLRTKELVAQGYDGVRVNLPSGEKHLTIFDPSVIKTREQLTDIWNQANKPSYLNEMLNKARTEGERGFVKLPFSGKTVKAIDALTKKELIDTAAYIRSNTYNKTKQDALDALAEKYEINTESGDKKLVLKQINALLNKTKTPETLPGTYTRKRI